MSPHRNFWIRSLTGEPDEEILPGLLTRTLVSDYDSLMGNLSAYQAKTLPGSAPHSSHQRHPEDEIVIVISGELEADDGHSVRRMGPGSMAHYPSGIPHLNRCVSDEPAHLLILKWRGRSERPAGGDADLYIHPFLPRPENAPSGIRTEGQAVWRETIDGSKMRLSQIRVDGGHGAPLHDHRHDLAIVLLEGRYVGLGHDTPAPAVIFYPAGFPHLLTPNEADADFLAVEFHGRTADEAPA